MSYEGKINTYTCMTCGGRITTIDRDEGTTPMLLLCRATENCPGRMFSALYRADQTLTPDYEWYKPTGKIRKIDREHVAMGGLLIRRIAE